MVKREQVEAGGKKTECFLLTERKIQDQISLRVGATEIMTLKVVQYLGVLVPGNRMFSEHVDVESAKRPHASPSP